MQNGVAYLAFLASSSSISALAMSPALCCRMTSTSERLSTRSRMSSVRACSCWGVLGISMFSTSLATASMLSRSALSSTDRQKWHRCESKLPAVRSQYSTFLSTCSFKKQNHGKSFLLQTAVHQGIKKASLGWHFSLRRGPAGTKALLLASFSWKPFADLSDQLPHARAVVGCKPRRREANSYM